jgi:hypothetical protein
MILDSITGTTADDTKKKSYTRSVTQSSGKLSKSSDDWADFPDTSIHVSSMMNKFRWLVNQ